MLENLISNQFKYKKLTEAEQQTRGILGRLVGPIADTVNPTRNGRKYSPKLWENVFENPIMKEKIANRCCFGELNHPADRTEIDVEKVAICLAEQPKKGKDGLLYGVFDILNTPNGKILKALCDYGCNIGISSRGQGDLITDECGDEAVDPDTYDCECFDAVLIPGVESARLKYVTENLDTHKKSLKDMLTESVNSATDDAKVIMKETLKELNLDIGEAKKVEDEEDIIDEVEESDIIDDEVEVKAEEKVDTDTEQEVEAQETAETDEKDNTEIEVVDAEKEEVEDSDADEEDDEEDDEEEITDEEIFLDFLANNFEEDKIKKVCKILDIEIEGEEAEDDEEEVTDEDKDSDADVKETSDEDINDKEKSEQSEEELKEAIDDGTSSLIISLKEALKSKSDLENIVKSLQEKLAVSDAKVDGLNEDCERYKSAIARLSTLAKSTNDLKQNVSALEESLTEKESIIKSQKTRIARLVEARKANITEKANSEEILNESLSKNKQNYEAKINTLNEQLATKTKESEDKDTKISQLTESIEKTSSIKESYRKLANKAVNKYIDVKADMLGLVAKDIKRKLGESYTLEDVDQVCEDLKSYQLNVSKLPFSIDRQVSVRVNESAKRPNVMSKSFEDDDVDSGLIKLANFDI